MYKIFAPVCGIHNTQYRHTHTHVGTFKVLEEVPSEDVFFSSEENLAAIISTPVAADIMNWAFQT